MTALKEHIAQELDRLNEEQLKQLANFIAFMKYQARCDLLQEKKSKLAEMFGEFASEDRVMAEEGMAEYAELLRRED
jgi:hypothetical protein